MEINKDVDLTEKFLMKLPKKYQFIIKSFILAKDRPKPWFGKYKVSFNTYYYPVGMEWYVDSYKEGINIIKYIWNKFYFKPKDYQAIESEDK